MPWNYASQTKVLFAYWLIRLQLNVTILKPFWGSCSTKLRPSLFAERIFTLVIHLIEFNKIKHNKYKQNFEVMPLVVSEKIQSCWGCVLADPVLPANVVHEDFFFLKCINFILRYFILKIYITTTRLMLSNKKCRTLMSSLSELDIFQVVFFFGLLGFSMFRSLSAFGLLTLLYFCHISFN